jgi:murein DD-endopeptidase MepM/ murein hydrolase activator NlpD
VANHRAGRRVASRPTAEPTAVAPRNTAGKRKAVKPSRSARKATAAPRPVPTDHGAAPAPKPVAPAAPRRRPDTATTPRRRPDVPGTPRRRPVATAATSAPSLVGVAALVVAATGAVNLTDGDTNAEPVDFEKVSLQASALTGSSAIQASDALDNRQRAVSRDSQREALKDAAAEELRAAAEAQAKERNAALAELAASAEKHAEEIAANAWSLPLSGYDLTAGFGESSGLWASTHTGLDFAAPSGTPVSSVANGTVTSAGYDGSYGNKLVVTLEDGTEIWYCHLTAFSVSTGESVNSGDLVGTVGSTGNSTGPHLHLEVRPGAGDPVDPYAALVAHGLQP